MAGEDKNRARDAKMIKELLESMGVKEYEPVVIDQFQELYYRTATDLLKDAQRYSSHADKATIDIADVKLAIESRRYLNDTQPPTLAVLEAAMTASTTAVPRPPSEGVSLPPESDMLISSKDLDELSSKQKEDENAPARFPNSSA